MEMHKKVHTKNSLSDYPQKIYFHIFDNFHCTRIMVNVLPERMWIAANWVAIIICKLLAKYMGAMITITLVWEMIIHCGTFLLTSFIYLIKSSTQPAKITTLSREKLIVTRTPISKNYFAEINVTDCLILKLLFQISNNHNINLELRMELTFLSNVVNRN